MATTVPHSPAESPVTAVLAVLAEAIRRDGPLSFEAYMARCLYDEEFGYYARAACPVGRAGDFHTSVSVGPVFGQLVAEWLAQSWEVLGRPGDVTLVEQGAHDGRLMADVLEALASEHPELREAATPVIVEPLAARRAEQRARLSPGHPGPAGGRPPAPQWIEALEDAAGVTGGPVLFFANELLDAFPAARWRFTEGRWHRLMVGLDGTGGLTWATEPAANFRLPGVEESLAALLPDGYETETCPGLEGWVKTLASVLRGGRAVVIDYGREAADYFAPHRTAGTLRGYRGHHRCDDPLAHPGETDLTTDVNFSALAEAARAAGLRMTGPERQGMWLTRLARGRLLEDPPPDVSWCRQFQTLTHPNHLGHQFHAVILEG